MFHIEKAEIDGVPVLWADTGDGPFVGALQFGVGRADETAAAGGITHLVEHLALASFGLQEFDHNGFVDPRRSVFHASGTPDEVAAHIGAVCRSIHDLPLARVGLERRILRDEAEQAGPNIGGALRWYRFGSVGHGLPGLDELGLTWLGPDRVRAWATEHYTRSNAVLWLSGRPPADLRLELPDGSAPGRRSVRPIPDVRFPAHVPWSGPGVAISYLAPRSSESSVTAGVLERRARQHLRFEKGLVYDVAFDYEPLDGATAHVIIGADCPADRIPAVRDALLGVMRELADAGPREAELGSEVSAFQRSFGDRPGRLGYLDAMAGETLLGEPVRQPQELADRRAAVTAEGARVALVTGLASLLVLAGTEPMTHDPWHVYPAWSSSAVQGREFRAAGFHLPGRAPRERLILGADGVSHRSPEGALTVRWDDVVAVVHQAPRVRIVIGADGFQVVVAAEAWRDGDAAVAAIDAAVPAVVVACDEHGVGGLAVSEDEGAA